MSKDSPDKNKRWYDHDPLLAEVLETLKAFQDELKAQSAVFLEKLIAEVGQEAIDSFYKKVVEERGNKFGNRWYDKDPTVSKAVELLRVLPPDVQRKAAQSFLSGLESQGITLKSKS